MISGSLDTARDLLDSARELSARGADMDWDQAIAFTLTQTTQALSEIGSQTQP